MMEGTPVSYELPPLPPYTIRPLPRLVPFISDQHLSLALPILAYWAVSLIFHLVDEWDLFPQYRLHTPAEVVKRNHVSRWDVFRDVVIQQVIQTAFGLGLAFVEPELTHGKELYDVAVWAQRIRIAQRAVPAVLGTVGLDAIGLAKNVGTSNVMLAGALSGGFYPDLTQTVLMAGQTVTTPAFARWELLVAQTIYYVAIPAVQFLLAICVVDTWQYFLHRAMHMNKYLYTTFHSRHHRLYVPYAYGALYNHPFEGFLLDTLGTGVAFLVSGMTCRQSIWFFTLSTIKTVDDHCGYAFPWDPFQRLTSNNAGYHDVHHQSWGIKTNFSQPFFTFWDGFLGTKWVGGDVSARYERAKVAAQKKVDADSKPITASQASESVETSVKPYENEFSNASSLACSTQATAQPYVPPGKASQQAIGSRQQVLDDGHGGGIAVIAEESAEEVIAQQKLQRRSPRKRGTSSGLKGLADRFGESLHGKSSGVLGMENGRCR